MDASKSCKKNQTRESIAHIRSRNDATPSSGSYKGGPPNTGYGSTHGSIIRPSGTCVMDGQVMTLSPRL
jgi:hypothetical protein